jgi:hypothetical protein
MREEQILVKKGIFQKPAKAQIPEKIETQKLFPVCFQMHIGIFFPSFLFCCFACSLFVFDLLTSCFHVLTSCFQVQFLFLDNFKLHAILTVSIHDRQFQ